MEALQSGLAGIAGGGGENENILFHTLYILGGGEQLRKHGQGHILKGRGGPTEQFQHLEGTDGYGGSQVFCFKFAGIGPVYQGFHIRNVRQQG